MSKIDPVAFENSVFINCPFDPEYKPLLNALLFTLIKFGFIPRIALESSDSGVLRITKILEMIKESKYSIHDLSRLQAKREDEYYRLNMPFELGIDFGARKFDKTLAEKRFLVLEASSYDYMKALSDFNGFDIKSHKNNQEDLISSIRSWLIDTANLRDLDAPMKIRIQFNEFNQMVFDKKFTKYFPEFPESMATEMANEEIDLMPIPELIEEIFKFFIH